MEHINISIGKNSPPYILQMPCETVEADPHQ